MRPAAVMTGPVAVTARVTSPRSRARPLQDRHSRDQDPGRLPPHQAAGAGIPLLDRKRAEATQFDPVAPRQGAGDFVEDGGDDPFYVAMEEMRVTFSKPHNQFRLCHPYTSLPVPACPDWLANAAIRTELWPSRCQVCFTPSRVSLKA